MAISCHDLKTLAQEQSLQSTEPWWRSAISRAYYATYHRCLAWEEALPAKSNRQSHGCGLHLQFIHRLASPHAACGKKLAERSRDLAKLMERQRKRRKAADYLLEHPVDQKDLMDQLKDTRTVFMACER